MGTEEDSTVTVGRPRRTRLRTLLLGICLVIFGYGVSIGPAYRALRKDALSQQTFSFAYSPVLSLSDHSVLFFRAMDWYCELWYSDGREWSRRLQEWHRNNE